jgi:hypothetical protein
MRPGVAAAAPAGYTVVSGVAKVAKPGRAVSAYATCPAGTVPVGGGAGNPSASLSVGMSSTFPSGGKWVTKVANDSVTNVAVTPWAICIAPPKGLRIVRATATDPPGIQLGAAAVCPPGKVILGGGVKAATPLLQSIGKTEPRDDYSG